MADTEQNLRIKVLGFVTKYERLPTKGGPLDENIDVKGFLVDAKGKRIMSDQEVDWVHYAPAHSPINTGTWERIKHIEVTDDMLSGEVTERLNFMRLKWEQIEPAYRAWKAGHEMPTSGTPLGLWPGVTAEKAEVLRRYGIRSVEDVRDLTEGQLDKVQLPGMRELRKEARAFLDNRGAAETARRDAERDAEIEALKAQLAETQAQFSAAMDMLSDASKAGAETIDDVRADLDALNVKYHHKAGIDTLRALRDEAKAGKAA